MAYWVQLELKGVGNSTGAAQFDFEKVTWIRFSRENGRLKGIEFHYVDGLICFEGEQAEIALAAWKEYLRKTSDGPGQTGLRYTAPESKAGVVQLAGLGG